MRKVSYFTYKANRTNQIILHHLCYASRKLWNVGNYEKRNWSKEQGVPFPNWYEQKKRLKTHFWYKQLPAQSAQEVLKVLQEAWVSFFKLKESNGIDNPQPPRFKHQNFNVRFLNNSFKLVENNTKIRLPIPKAQKAFLKETYGLEESYLYIPIPKHIEIEKIKLIEVKPISRKEYTIYLIQEYKDVPLKQKNSTKFLSIDLGIANAMTCYDYQGKAHIISGRQWLSVERYFHKQIAHFQAIGFAQQCAKGIQYPKPSRRVLQLYQKKRKQVHHMLHCMTRKVIDIALQQGVEMIVIGDLTGIREQAKFNKKTNQKLHGFPYAKIIQMIRYKAQEQGIEVRLLTEEYTSQACSVCQMFPCEENAKPSNRIHRGLYVCNDCHTTINADVNGAINISKKYLKEIKVLSQSVVVLDTPTVYTFNGQQFVA